MNRYILYTMKRIHHTLLLLFFVVFVSNSNAQVDSVYVRSYERPLSVRLYTQSKIINMNYEYGDDNEKSFVSNTPLNIGFGLGWKKTMISGSITISQLRDKSKGRTTSFDFQYRYYGQKIIGDIILQRYKGLYNDKSPYLAYPNLRVNRYGVAGHYIFNHRKFSYSAVFDNTELQRNSAGSFHLGGMALYTKVNADSVFLFKDNYRQKNIQFGVSGGYAYTWVWKRNYYLTGSLSVGVNLGIDDIPGLHNKKLGVYPSLYSRIATGYNGKGWTVSLSAFIFGSELYRRSNDQLSLMSADIQLTYVRRFRMKSSFLDKITGNKK